LPVRQKSKSKENSDRKQIKRQQIQFRQTVQEKYNETIMEIIDEELERETKK
jgi:hypothetical protein